MTTKIFTIEQDEKLIEMVRNHPMLYNYNHKDYRDMEAKMKLWKLIADTFGVTPEVCHVRWRTIRDTHRRNVNRTRSKGKLSFKSKYTEKVIEFLNSTFKENLHPMTFVDDPDPVCVVQLEEVDCSESLDDSNHGEKDDRFETFVDDYIELEAPTASPEATPTKKKKKKKSHYPKLPDIKTVSLENEKSAWDSRDKDPLEIMDNGKESRDIVKKIWLSGGNIVDMSETVKSGSGSDREKSISEIIVGKTCMVEKTPSHPVDNFFSSMADVVKTFPPHLIAEARMKVCQVVSELEIRALQKNDPVLPSSLPNSSTAIESSSNRSREPLTFDSPHYLQL